MDSGMTNGASEISVAQVIHGMPVALAHYQAISRCIESGEIAYARMFSRHAGGACDDTGPVLWSYSGSPGLGYNRVVAASIQGEEREQVANAVARFREWKSSFAWMVGPSTQPANLPKYLQEAGLNFYYWGDGMALDISRLPAEWPTPAGVTIRALTHAEALDNWQSIDWATWDIANFTDLDRESIRSAFARIPGGCGPDWFVAYRGKEPVCRCLVLQGSGPEIVSLHKLRTRESETGKGIGTAVSWYALDQARQRGCKLAVLTANDDSYNIYRRLGFESCGRTALFYAWHYQGGEP